MNHGTIASNSEIPKKIGIAMSGGVDSTATALLLRDKAELHGFFMHLAQPDYDVQLARVQEVAERIGIPLEVVDLTGQFKEKVLEYFRDAYFAGLTPNPCMVCNREIKFGLFQDAILSKGMDLMATGHYVRLVKRDGRYRLLQGVDPSKDQSYFLARLTADQLSKILFPLGEYLKKDIYKLVEEHGFTDFQGTESQDVCFFGNESVGDYLSRLYPERVKPGPIVATNGEILGHHRGLFRYTVGQRRGLGIPDSSPWYVYGMDGETNQLFVCKNDELFTSEIQVIKLHWTNESPLPGTPEVTVRIRYSHKGSTARLEPADNDSATLIFKEPQRAVTPGQFAVFYSGAEVIGSGIIS